MRMGTAVLRVHPNQHSLISRRSHWDPEAPGEGLKSPPFSESGSKVRSKPSLLVVEKEVTLQQHEHFSLKRKVFVFKKDPS